MITGNKGEWSEIYTLLKVISDKQLFTGDSDLNKIESLIFPIIKVLRKESNGTFEFSYDNDLVIVNHSNEKFKIPINKFQEQAHLLLSRLQEKTSSTFSIPQIEDFINSYNSHSLKAQSSAKTDITIIIHDQRTGSNPTLGFSIKSQLGSPSTLLNAGKTTNFIYKIIGTNLSNSDICEINSIKTRSKIMDRITQIHKKGGKLEFFKTEQQVFSNNLVLIDSLLPEILSQIIIDFYSSKFSSLKDLVQRISSKNPLNFDTQNNHKFYKYKLKRFLTDVALGMMPSIVWTGEYDATGGFLVVKENGDVLCYHIYNRNEFENYLLNNTKLETPSSSRHNFGEIYKLGNEIFFKLNLQIRFLK